MITFTELQVLERIEGWKEKAQSDDDQFNRFMSLWIAYNMIYCLYSKHVKPRESKIKNDSKKAIRMKNLISGSDELRQYLISVAPNLIDILNHFRDEKWGNDNITLKIHLENFYRNSNYENLLDIYLKILYKIRCNLFHGEKSYYSQRQHQLLELCSNILVRILSISINNFKSAYNGEN